MVIQQQGSASVIKLPQQFAGSVVKDVMSLVYKALDSGSYNFVFDFSESELVDSSGIGTLVSIAKEVQTRGAQLTLKNLNEDLHQLFIDTGLDKIFTIEREDGGIKEAEIDLFENSVDIRLDIKKETVNQTCVFRMSGVMNHPIGSRYFKQQFLLALANFKRILLDFDDLTFFDSLSISAILNMNKLLKETGGSLRICRANYIIKDLFVTLNIDSIIPVFDTQDEAFADWK